MTDAVVEVLAAVRERVTPTDAEREALEAVTDEIVERAEAAVADLPVEADVQLVGSAARGTWTPGDRDVDVFVCLPPALDRETLEEYGLQVGHVVLPEGREEYAEHPYVVGTVDGYEVDLVPCYAVDDPTAIQSAVDRTPFHAKYVTERLDDHLASEVRVCKSFMKAIGVYGSNLKTRGFSGYLTELLVLEYDGVRGLFEAVAEEWHPPVRLDPEDHGTVTFADPLVVIDPTDPERNVAAVLSEDNLARFQHYARAFLADPSADAFEPTEPDPIDEATLAATFEERGTTPVAIVFDAQDLVDDQLWPQLRRSLGGITGELDRRGFDVFRSASFADDDRAVLFAELAVAELPAVERHEGPPVHVREHAQSFYETYADDESATGPFVEDGRYVVERKREFRTAQAFLESDAVFEVALGAEISNALDDGYDVLVVSGVAALADDFGTDLAAYLDPKP
jgi:tRNA nucleotidyltransferase (CCA-adding enzyme)